MEPPKANPHPPKKNVAIDEEEEEEIKKRKKRGKRAPLVYHPASTPGSSVKMRGVHHIHHHIYL